MLSENTFIQPPKLYTRYLRVVGFEFNRNILKQANKLKKNNHIGILVKDIVLT